MRYLLAVILAAFAFDAQACRYPPGWEGSFAEADGFGVTFAEYHYATERYTHGVLGDTVEGGGLIILARDKNGGFSIGCGDQIILPDDRVFEDLAPRIADVNGDGLNDVVVVETQVDTGASLAVYSYVPNAEPLNIQGVRYGRLRKLAATPHIGRPFRWLAPAGIADFDGDGQNDIAYVETPHIGGILRIWTMRDGDLVEIASAPGYSNHRIGQNFITGGVRDCGDGPELVLPNAGWTQTLVARLRGGVIESAVLADNAEPETIARALACS